MTPQNKMAMKARARNVWLKIAYDGTDYCGFQRQSPPKKAVANVLEAALAKVCKEPIEITGAGRTDAGVHAIAQIVNFFTDCPIPAEKIPPAVNGYLPNDVKITAAGIADGGFSALHSRHTKTYLYKITTGVESNPFFSRYHWQIRQKLDVAAMQNAAAFLVGSHDFTGFTSPLPVGKSPVKNINAADITATDFTDALLPLSPCGSGMPQLITFTVSANGFFYHLVRNLAGFLVKIGLGQKNVDDFRRLLNPPTVTGGNGTPFGRSACCAPLSAPDGTSRSFLAPACGLYMKSVVYLDYPAVK